MSVAAIIVLYNPNFEKLQRLYLSVCNQVSLIVFVDNTPVFADREKNKQWITSVQNKNNYYLSMQENLGIATAQNAGIKFAKSLNINFVLLLDQDSVLPDKMVCQLLKIRQKILDDGHRVFAVGPSFVDEKTNKISKITKCKSSISEKPLYMEVSYVISSGTIIDIETIDKVGLLDDKLFIDWVDIEWCLRAKNHGLNSYVVPSVIMRHCIGDENIKFLHINLHSDFRNYFIVRNSLYLALYGGMPINFRVIQLFKTPAYVLLYSYYSKNSFYSLKLLLIAIKDAILRKMGKGYFENKGL